MKWLLFDYDSIYNWINYYPSIVWVINYKIKKYHLHCLTIIWFIEETSDANRYLDAVRYEPDYPWYGNAFNYSSSGKPGEVHSYRNIRPLSSIEARDCYWVCQQLEDWTRVRTKWSMSVSQAHGLYIIKERATIKYQQLFPTLKNDCNRKLLK